MLRLTIIRLIVGSGAGLVLVASFWYLATTIDWPLLQSQLQEVAWLRFIVLIWLIQVLYLILRTVRLLLLVRNVNSDIGFLDLYGITGVTVCLALLTPGQSGEAMKIELLKRRGLLNRLPGLGAFALERLYDLIVIALIGLMGLLFGSGLAVRYSTLVPWTCALIGVGVVIFYLLVLRDPIQGQPQWLMALRTGSGRPVTRTLALALTICSWWLVALTWQLSLDAVGISLTLLQTLWLMALVTLATLASLIPGGLGVAEVVTMVALTDMGIDPTAAQAGAMMLRAYALVIVLLGFLHLPLISLRRSYTMGISDDSAH